jgi:hypothetical protein
MVAFEDRLSMPTFDADRTGGPRTTPYVDFERERCLRLPGSEFAKKYGRGFIESGPLTATRLRYVERNCSLP